ncbi:hypothetical protein [Bosea sp. LjRoot237]|uniref:hypothetical protein n=1 Tax=Bosea sp. LjRoot237 TaxID=3342292 RepID=UPI003ECE23E7
MTAPLPPTTACDADLVAELRATQEVFTYGHEPRRYIPPSELKLRAADRLDKLSAEVAAVTAQSEQRLACMDRRADRIIELTTEREAMRAARMEECEFLRSEASRIAAALAAAEADAAGLSSEGFAGGYLAALYDVEAALSHGFPSDHRGYWRRARSGEEVDRG